MAIQSTVLNGLRIGALQTGPAPAGVGDLSYFGGARIDVIVGLDVRQVALGARVCDTLPAWALDRVPDGYPPSIDGVLGVLALDCHRVQFD